MKKYIIEFKSKIRPQDTKLKRVKDSLLNSAMTLLETKEMTFKVFENAIFLKPKKLIRSEQSRSDDKYTSLKSDNNLNTQFFNTVTVFQAIKIINHINQRKEKDLK